MEFLAFIVPGFILCITLPFILGYCLPEPFDIMKKEPITFAWVSFLLISYIMGHFLHHICALLLNPLYNKTYFIWKKNKYKDFITKSEKLIGDKIKVHNGYLKTAEAYLKVNHTSLIPELEKHLANSKLFRSLCLLSLYLCFLPNIDCWTRFFLILFSCLSFSKFAHERWSHRISVYRYFNLVN